MGYRHGLPTKSHVFAQLTVGINRPNGPAFVTFNC